jgi:hypothetical protein
MSPSIGRVKLTDWIGRPHFGKRIDVLATMKELESLTDCLMNRVLRREKISTSSARWKSKPGAIFLPHDRGATDYRREFGPIVNFLFDRVGL